MINDIRADIDAVQRLDAVPRLLDAACGGAGMGSLQWRASPKIVATFCERALV
jgi:hypothetical protein